MTEPQWDDEVAELAARLETQRPRPSRGLRRRVGKVLTAGLQARALRRQAVTLVAAGVLVLTLAGALAASALPT